MEKEKSLLQETVGFLVEMGYDARVCDYPVENLGISVPCGMPTDCPTMGGDKEYVMLPSSMLKGSDMLYVIYAHGESMVGRGIDSGDELTVMMSNSYEDGDVVIATLDNETTVKTYFCDEYGEKWLLPHNDAFEPIRISDYDQIIFSGKVISIRKPISRMRYSECSKLLSNYGDIVSKATISDDKIYDVLKNILPKITNSRKWYAVYRAMVDVNVLHDGEYAEFVDKIKLMFPDAEVQPTVNNLQRMCMFSFSKSVINWNAHEAPVSGKTFVDYKMIAMQVIKMLGGRTK